MSPWQLSASQLLRQSNLIGWLLLAHLQAPLPHRRPQVEGREETRLHRQGNPRTLVSRRAPPQQPHPAEDLLHLRVVVEVRFRLPWSQLDVKPSRYNDFLPSFAAPNTHTHTVVVALADSTRPSKLWVSQFRRRPLKQRPKRRPKKCKSR